MLNKTLVQLVLLALGLGACQAAVYNKLVRVSLGRTTAAQAGNLGQPVTSYYANVEIGTPPKRFKVLVDVNAREVWVPHHSKLGLVAKRLNYMDGYSKKDSSSAEKEDTKYELVYRECELSGKAYRDYLEFRNVTESMYAVRFMQRFLAISSASNDNIGKLDVDGVLPMNPWPISESGSDLIATGLRRANMTDALEFAILFDENKRNPDYGGELSFGGPNPINFIGMIRYHQIVSQFSWEIRSDGVMLGAEYIACGQRRGQDKCTAIVSTSQNDISGPVEDVKHIMRLLGYEDAQLDNVGSKLFDVDCLAVSSMPTLTFSFDGSLYTIPAAKYVRKKVDGLIFKSESCYLSILGDPTLRDQWILGTSFLSHFYTVFDINHRGVAFANRK